VLQQDGEQRGADGARDALQGVHRALIGYVHRRVLAGDAAAGLAADVRDRCAAAFALLGHGLRDYPVG
jgi:hypothetical protein